MKNLAPPFKFDLRPQLSKARRNLNNQVGNISINLPFISFSIDLNNIEEKVAKEIVIRMSDKRVLNAYECSDNCINQVLASLQDIRKFLVDKQVELSNAINSPLYLLIEFQLEAIRQFLTFGQRLKQDKPFKKESYFAALELLRSHLHLIHKTKDAESRIKPGRRHREVNHEWYQLNGIFWNFSNPFPDSIIRTFQSLKDLEGPDSAEDRMVSDTHDYIDRIWDYDDLSKLERDQRRNYLEGFFIWLLFNPKILKNWAGVDVLKGEIKRLIDGKEIWEDAIDIKSKYEGLLRRTIFKIRIDRKLRYMLEKYGQ